MSHPYLETLSHAFWVGQFDFSPQGQLILGCNTEHGSQIYLDSTSQPLFPNKKRQSHPLHRGTFLSFLEETGSGYQVVCYDIASQTLHTPDLAPFLQATPLCAYGNEHLVGLRVDASGAKKLVLAHVRNETTPIELLDLPQTQQASQLALSCAPISKKLVLTRKTTGPYSEIVLVEPEQQRSRVLFAGSGNMTPVSASWNVQEDRLICMIRTGTKLSALLLDPETLTSQELDLPPLAEPPLWHPNGTSLLLTLDQWPVSRFALYDLSTSQLTKLELLPAHMLASPRWQEGQLYFRASGSQEPFGLYRWCPETAVVDRITAKQDFPVLAEPEILAVETERGYTIPCLVYHPEQPTDRTVFFLHGGPAGAWKATWHPLLQLLLTMGIRVIMVNPRGSTVRNWTLPALKAGEFGKADVQDILDCIQDAYRSGLARPGAVGLYGQSYGGYLATLTMQNRGQDIGATLLMNSYWHPSILLQSKDPAVQRFAHYAFSESELSPPETIDFATFATPLLQVHGELDVQLPFAVTKAMFERLPASHCEFMALPGETHVVRDRQQVCAWIARAATFFDQHLPRT